MKQKSGGFEMRLGFSYIGLIMLCMLMVPNMIWSKNQPKDYNKFVVNENKVLLILERVGEVVVTILALIFQDFNFQRKASWWNILLVVALIVMILYEIYWIRYFKSERRMEDMYSSILGVPVAGATLPVIAFFLLGLYGKNIIMIIAVVFLGIGHIGIHLNHLKELQANKM